MPTMTVGIVLGPSPGARTNLVEDVLAQARSAAANGVRSAWFAQRFDYDAVTVAALVGRETPDLQVGTSVVPIFGRHPLPVAGQALTAQAATYGRFSLGIGLGAKSLVESAFGERHDRTAQRLAEFVTALRQSFMDGSVDVRGETLTAVSPAPTAVPGAAPVPILVAAMGPRALAVTGELADGTLPFLAGPKALAEHIAPPLRAAAEHAGRPAPKIVALVQALVTDDADAARERLAAQSAFYDRIPSYQRVVALSGASKAAELALVGSEEQVSAGVGEYFDAGADEVVLTQTDLLGEETRDRTRALAGRLTRSAGAQA